MSILDSIRSDVADRMNDILNSPQRQRNIDNAINADKRNLGVINGDLPISGSIDSYGSEYLLFNLPSTQNIGIVAQWSSDISRVFPMASISLFKDNDNDGKWDTNEPLFLSDETVTGKSGSPNQFGVLYQSQPVTLSPGNYAIFIANKNSPAQSPGKYQLTIDVQNSSSQPQTQTPTVQSFNTTDAQNSSSQSQSLSQSLNTTKMYRFQNESQPGTYLFASEGEAASIRRNFSNFKEEGLAFQVSVDKNDPLMQGFYRFRNTAPGREGTYLFVGEQEANAIRQNYNNFIDEGLAFYAHSGGTGSGTVDFARFQSKSVPGTYLFTSPGETAAVLNNPNFTYEGIAFAAFG